ncbi:NAD(P)/FAD-dependent oxidoreductase [Runella sp.]|uniref:NAD(P)/FAD-dependent oxidoreductase n=1 Tax=Runella sp. TaxID=1960881 RepID=UPI003D144EBB
MTADYLIVGQGIAGSILAWTLSQRGHHVLILNDPTLPSASKVSAGIFNPLTGKKLSRTWKADELFPFAHKFYSEMQQLLEVEFLHDCDVYRPFRSIEEQNSYIAQTADPTIAKYVIDRTNDAEFAPYIQNQYGGLQITRSGWVDCTRMLQKIETYFSDKKQYSYGKIDYQKIEIQEDGVKYGELKIKKILFCEGFEARQNPFFSWLPFNPVKGQSLIAFIDNYPIKEIVNQGVFILSIDGKGKCRLGATYTWHDIDWETTEDARAYLQEKINVFLKTPYQILEQQVGIRPSTKDRRPFVGIHPEYPSLGIFNGLGTKGVSLAPYFAEQFAKFLETGEEINKEANIERVFSLYFRSK